MRPTFIQDDDLSVEDCSILHPELLAWSSRHAWAAHNPAIEKTVEPSTAEVTSWP